MDVKHDDTLYSVLNDQNEVGASQEEEAHGDFLGSVATLSNSAIGAGVLAFPFAFKVTHSIDPFLYPIT